jgi:hypothetical protein
VLQPIAVLREAGVNWWWLCVQNSRFSDTLLAGRVPQPSTYHAGFGFIVLVSSLPRPGGVRNTRRHYGEAERKVKSAGMTADGSRQTAQASGSGQELSVTPNRAAAR